MSPQRPKARSPGQGQVTKRYATVPNALSLARIIAIPYLGVLVYFGQTWVFFVAFIVAGLTDVLDGLAARYLNQRSHIGKVLDAFADLAFLLATAAFAWFLFSQYLRPVLPVLFSLLGVIALSLAVSLVRFKRPVLMHTMFMKINIWGAIIAFLLSFFFDTTIIMAIVLVSYIVAFLEQTVIFFLVSPGELEPDTPSVFSVLKQRKARR